MLLLSLCVKYRTKKVRQNVRFRVHLGLTCETVSKWDVWKKVSAIFWQASGLFSPDCNTFRVKMYQNEKFISNLLPSFEVSLRLGVKSWVSLSFGVFALYLNFRLLFIWFESLEEEPEEKFTIDCGEIVVWCNFLLENFKSLARWVMIIYTVDNFDNIQTTAKTNRRIVNQLVYNAVFRTKFDEASLDIKQKQRKQKRQGWSKDNA